MKLLLASKNRGKIREVKEILSGKVDILSTLDLPLDLSIIEDGKNLEENAIKKAYIYFKTTGYYTLGEDTGLEVKALDGRPGVNSSRYSGGNDRQNMKKLLDELKEERNREAQFRTVMALVINSRKIECFEGIIKGSISFSEKGHSGFGYDPVFIPEGYLKTFAEMGNSEKNQISHRRIALDKVLKFIEKNRNLFEKQFR